ncbi:MAG: hypothetical protein HYV62_00930 [Candidatus Rokubacteria bacterium]|nr:hypothetical protein [Candidatus Rokubacteria bacterium]
MPAHVLTSFALGLALIATAVPVPAQEIYQAVLLDLTAEQEVHVIVARARGDEQVRCLLRDAAGRVRVAGARPVSAGLTSGGTTILTIPLPLPNPGEREFAVVLLRGDVELHRTGWRPLFRQPERRTTP